MDCLRVVNYKAQNVVLQEHERGVGEEDLKAQLGCKCRNSRCLKLYCVCFAASMGIRTLLAFLAHSCISFASALDQIQSIAGGDQHRVGMKN